MSENIQKSPLPCGGGLGVGETQSIKQGYKQTSLGILPQEWEVVRLGDICELFAGGDAPKEHFSKLKTAQYQIPIFSNGIGVNALYGYTNKAKIDKPCITISARGTIGHCILHTEPFFPIVRLIVVLPNPLVIIDFLKHYIDSIDIESTNAGIPQLTIPMISHLQIPLPPLAEQEKIAQILGVWDKGISVLKSLIEAKTKRKKALMQRLLTPPTPLTPSAREGEQKSHHDTKAPPLAGGVGVGYSHIENNRNDDKVLDCHDLTASNLAMTEKNSKAKQSLRFAEFTDKWQEFRFNDIFIRIPSKKYQIQTKEYQLNGKYPVIDQGQTAIIGYSNNESKVFKNSSVIVFGDHTRELKFIDFDFIVGADGVQLLRTKDEFNDRFFYYQLQIKKIPNTGYNRHFKFLLDMPFVCPTLTEQKKIAQVLSACDKEIELLKSKFQCLKMQKRGLMQRLLNGEVRVKC